MTKDYCIGSDRWNGLSKVIEEAGELSEVLSRLVVTAGKLIGSEGETDHWSGDLKARMIEEIADLEAGLYYFKNQNMTSLEMDAVDERFAEKVNRFMGWDRETRDAAS